MDADAAQVLAAIATSIAALVTATMAWHTRKLAKSTVGLAVEAREQTELSRQSLVEAQRVRLDSAGPTITVTAGPAVVFEPSQFGEANDISVGHPYELPAREHQQLGLRAQFTLKNEGNVTATVRLDGTNHKHQSSVPHSNWVKAPPPATGRDHEYRVEPGLTWVFSISGTKSVAEWLDSVGPEDQLQTALEIHSEIVVQGLADQGIVDNHRLVLSGWPLRRDPDSHGRCTVNDDQVNAVAYPPERRYFLSKRRNSELERGSLSARSSAEAGLHEEHL